MVEVFTPPPDIHPSWQKVLSVIRVTRSGVRDGIAFSTLSYGSPKKERMEENKTRVSNVTELAHDRD